MSISKENREFVENLIRYYVSTAPAYKDLARAYGDASESLDDVAFGMIAGSVYSSFMQIYQNHHTIPDLEDIREFNQIMLKHSSEIRRAISLKTDKNNDTSGSNHISGLDFNERSKTNKNP